MIIKTNLSRYPKELVPDEYLIGEVEMLPIAAFEKIQAASMENHSEIARHGDQGVDLQSGNIITLLLVNDANMDGMLFDVGCHGRCVSAAYLPGIRAAIEYQVMGMVKRLVYDTIETTQNPDCTVPWKKLSKQLGFAVTEQSGLWSVIEETLDEIIDVRGYDLTTDGIELNLEPMACDIMQDEDQGLSMP